MEENTNELLEKVIREEIQKLSNLESGSKEKSDAIEDVVKLYKLKIEESKIKCDFDENYYSRIMQEAHHIDDVRFRENEEKEQTKDRYFRYGLEAFGVVSSLIFYGIWMNRGFKFEETGSYTSKTFLGLINRFKPTRK